MVQFHDHIITDLLEDSNGGLVITSSGLGLHKLISSTTTLKPVYLSSPPLLLKKPPFYENSLKCEVPNLPSEITSDLSANQRLSLYTSGGILFITSRILIVDLLTHRLPTSAVAGLVMLNAHSLSDTSTEAFIVRILRSTNRELYVRAFSDRPHSMVSGFAKAERTLKCLFLRKLHLWPRFQVYVSQDLERDPPEVVDVRVPMSTYMIGIQKAVIEVMDACLKEMRKTNKVDVEDLTVENGLFKSFDEIVRRQLDPIWHTLGKRARQLVSDLKTLRKLLDYLVRHYFVGLICHDAFVCYLFGKEGTGAVCETHLEHKRVFGPSGYLQSPVTRSLSMLRSEFIILGDQSTSAESRVVLEEVLEEPPKWKVLLDVLMEIQEERDKQSSSGEEKDHLGDGDDNGIVLVACKDEHSCMQLEDCITNGSQKVMREEWEKYLLSKKAEVSSISKQEHDALLAIACEVSKRINKDIIGDDDDQNHVDGGGFVKRKGKGKKKKGSAGEKTNNDVALNDNATEGGCLDEVFLRKHDQGLDAESSRENKKLPPVVFYALESDKKDGRCLGLDSSNEPQSVISQNQITRKAGGRREAEREMQVIVDMREFMSTLPNVLHQKGMRIIPVTLEVEMMSRYYRIPVLIEFSLDKSFSFQCASEIGDDVTPNSIISKHSLLVLHFPRLHIIWSRSLHATAEIFASLRLNQDEPDEVKAIRVDVPSEEGVVENDVSLITFVLTSPFCRAENYNTSAVEMFETAARRDRFQLQGNNGWVQKLGGTCHASGGKISRIDGWSEGCQNV
ncbi:hypothetical protein RND71_042668 [Anisodus tanguticus]|uniref:DNA repair endonuclease UVH1 n=1 Tax=Anisodus tanguticus TaxID=243964 RepID=A0AAE1QRD9_9SOLA|nr:hypothetical protein RND71_042668 [Anisodus tanguticus]